MYRLSRPLLLLVLLLRSSALAKNQHNNDNDLFHFVTRPTLKAPRWNVEVYDSEKLSEGHWFLAPKPSLERTIGSGDGWWGSAIYDQNGELIWSGADQLDQANIMDFRLSNVRGERMMTMLDHDRVDGIMIDNNYEVRDLVLITEDRDHVNGHEFNWVDNGKNVIVIQQHKHDATQEEKDSVGFEEDGECQANYNGFRVLDATNNYEIIFDWDAFGHIKLNESTMTDSKIKARCNTWDFIHANSVDKTPEGDYLFSARHCDTIYKISPKDGEIIWRLGGKQSDFELGDGVKFSRQHDVRSRGSNETHELLSILDNANGQDSQKPTHDFSRGILIALNRKTMQATLEGQYDHPREGYARRRGNMQILDNGNIFMGWSERALQSEHTPDGKLLMQARFMADWIGSYRNYKFSGYVGKPLTRPDVVSRVDFEEDTTDKPLTRVYVSWNGDTEVRKWKLYGTISSGNSTMQLLDETERRYFEHAFEYHGHAYSVQLKGLNASNEEIADSGIIKTISHPSYPEHPAISGTDHADNSNAEKTSPGPLGRHPAIPIVLFVLAAIVSATLVLLAWIGVLPLGWVAKLREKMSTAKRKRAMSAGEYEKVALEDREQVFDRDQEGYRDQRQSLERKFALSDEEHGKDGERDEEEEEDLSLLAEKTPEGSDPGEGASTPDLLQNKP